jgi:peptidoglycan/LPS O-acetylase OafA/YrhL
MAYKTDSRAMTPTFSVYLEIVRITATFLVFAAHGSFFYQPLNSLNEDAKLGRDGVIMFFVLSGYVISWCANEKEKSPLSFAINRASRIYSVALPAILLGGVVSLFISYYTGSSEIEYPFHKPWLYLPIYLSFTGNFWHLNEVPPSNFPYWSLNYEVWYYIIFAAFFYIRMNLRWPLVLGLLLLVGPSLLQLFPLWIAGSALYFWHEKIKIGVTFARLLLALSVLAFLLVKVFALDSALDQHNLLLWKFFPDPQSPPTQLLGDYLLGLIVVISFIAGMNSNFSFSRKIEKKIRYIASFSFSFYLFHIPIFGVFSALFPERNSITHYLAVMVSTALIIMFLAKYTEHKKYVYRDLFAKLARYPRLWQKQ